MGDNELKDFVKRICGDVHVRIEDDLGNGFVRLHSSEAMRRQAKHDIRCSEDVLIEMLRNSRDANASRIFIATNKDSDKRNFVVLDDGDGIPKNLHEIIFEPRVTSKLDSVCMDAWGVHGRGMALYSIACQADEARVTSSDSGLGACFYVKTDSKKIGERKDQSTYPSFSVGSDNVVRALGPRNLIRLASEFALSHRNTLDIYFGSSTQIAATLYALGQLDSDDHKVINLLSRQKDPASFAKIANKLGLFMSERSARRILDQEIEPIEDICSSILIEGLGDIAAENAHPVDLDASLYAENTEEESRKRLTNLPVKQKSNKKISKQDLEQLKSECLNSFSDLAEKYYLDPLSNSSISVAKSQIIIKIDLADV